MNRAPHGLISFSWRNSAVPTLPRRIAARLGVFFIGVGLALAASAADQAKPEQKAIAGLNLTMIKVTHGKFTMGDPPGPNGNVGDTGPQTEVTLTKDFWLGATEVTVGQFRFFVETTGYVSQAERDGGGIWVSSLDKAAFPGGFGSERRERREVHPGLSWRNPGYAQGESHPVVGISWNDAQQFCTWLTEREATAGRLPAGYVYRLPTEAQWEYAATTGGAKDPANPGDYSWYRMNSDASPHPVGTKRANAWGLFDMQGNVWEWVHDWYGRYPGGSVTDFEGPASMNAREIIRPHHERRGGWANDPAGHGIATTNRWSSWGQEESNWVGFRIALSPAAPPPPPTPPPAAKGATKKG